MYGISDGGISFVYGNSNSTYNLFAEQGYYLASTTSITPYTAAVAVIPYPAPTYTIPITTTTAAAPTTAPTTTPTTTHVSSGAATTTTASTTSPLAALAIHIIIPIIVGLLGLWWCLGQGRKDIDSAPSEDVITTNIPMTASSPVQQSAEADGWSERVEVVKTV